MYVSVYVDPEDVIHEVSSADLRAELKRRKEAEDDPFQDFTTNQLKEEIRARRAGGFFAEDREVFLDVLDALRGGDPGEAELLLERILEPKFPSPELALSSYHAARRSS